MEVEGFGPLTFGAAIPPARRWRLGWRLGRACASVCMVFAAAGPILAQQPAKVQIQIEPTVFQVEVADYEDSSLYPRRPSREMNTELDKPIKARQAELAAELSKASEEATALLREAEQAQAALGKLPRGERNSPEAQALQAVVNRWNARLREAEAGDAAMKKLRAEREEAVRRFQNRRTIEHKAPVVTLENGLVRVLVVPTLGARVLDCIDLQTNVGLDTQPNPLPAASRPISDVLAFNAGAVEASFPYFEHGMGVLQPAGWHTGHHADGSAYVAMNVRFTEHQEPRHMGRYGRYAQQELSVIVTLAPGQRGFDTRFRLENPTPLRASNRLWINTILHVERYDAEHLIYPAGYVMPHGGQSVTLFDPAQRSSWVDVSHFALFSDYGFTGIYNPKTDTNMIMSFDPREVPGMKLYTRRENGGFTEIWLGSNPLFEHPGSFVAMDEPVEFSTRFTFISGRGRVVWANEQMAIALEENRLRMLRLHPTFRPGEIRYQIRYSNGSMGGTRSGEPQGDQLVEIHNPRFTTQTFDLTFTAGDRPEQRISHPLVFEDKRPMLAEVKPLGGKFRYELEQICNHVGAPTSRDAIPQATALVGNPEAARRDPDLLISLGNTAYRWGHLDLALRCAELAGEWPEARYLAALVKYEKTGKADWAKTGVDGLWPKAAQAVAEKDTEQAIRLLDELLAVRPKAWRPRLMRAYLGRDAAAAAKLVLENPASAEAQYVAGQLGDAEAAKLAQRLVENNPGAPEALAGFVALLKEGKLPPLRRYAPMLPRN